MSATRKGLVLIVTHDPVLTRRVSSELAAQGFDVAEAIDSRDALAALQRRTPQLVLVDLSLPRESGFEVCEDVRALPACIDVQIVVLSDRWSPLDLAAAEEAGANAFMRKPLDVTSLAHCMVSMLERRVPSRSDFRSLRPSDSPSAL